jgi:hypothetical protein
MTGQPEHICSKGTCICHEHTDNQKEDAQTENSAVGVTLERAGVQGQDGKIIEFSILSGPIYRIIYSFDMTMYGCAPLRKFGDFLVMEHDIVRGKEWVAASGFRYETVMRAGDLRLFGPLE